MLIFTRMIFLAGRGFPQWVELRCDDMDRLHPLWPLPPAVSGQRPVSRVPAAATGAGRAEAHEVGRGRAWWHCYRVPSGLQETIVGRENRDCRVPLSGDSRGKNTDSPYQLASICDQNCFYNADHAESILTTSLKYRIFWSLAMVGNHSLSAERFCDREGGGGGHHRLLAALFSCNAIGSMLKSRIQGAPCPGVLPPIHRLCNFYKTREPTK